MHFRKTQWTTFCFSGLNAITNILNMFYKGDDLAGRSVCTAHIVIGALSLSSNPMFITVMATERFIAIHFPLKAKAWITASRTKKVRINWAFFIIPSSNWTISSKAIHSNICLIKNGISQWHYHKTGIDNKVFSEMQSCSHLMVSQSSHLDSSLYLWPPVVYNA